jgi:hypothetical protein
VVVTNSDNGAALVDEILCSIAAEYVWPEFQVIEKAALPGDASINREVAGEYRTVNLPAHIVAEGKRLYFQSGALGAKRMDLFAESKTAFFLTSQDMSLRFERSVDDTIAGFSLIRGANTYPATKTR